MAEVTPAVVPTVLLFGSSQIAYVKDAPEPSLRSIPYRLSDALGAEVPRHQVVDLSAPGQQLTESLAILLAYSDSIRPSAVVLGIGLFNMMRTDIRAAIRGALDESSLRRALVEITPAGATGARPDALRAILAPDAARGKSGDSTVQQRVDARVGSWLAAHSAAVANGRVLYNRLIDQPLRRDLVAAIQRRRGGIRTARTFEAGEEYGISLSALDAMSAFLRRRRIPFVVVVLPYDHGREPIAYAPASMTRLLTDLRARQTAGDMHVLDLSDALDTGEFGVYADGSPDGLHFRDAGHGIVGAATAKAVAPLLRSHDTHPGSEVRRAVQ